MEPVIQIKNLRTSFMTSNGEVQAVRGVSFSVNPGEILGVVGESGSGKSVTSMSILRLLADTAVIKENSEILFEGENLINVNKKKLRSIRGEKISMIFQEMSPFPNLTVAENMYIGREPHKLHFLKKKELREKAKAQLKKLNISLNIDTPVKNLTVSEMQLLEIAKAVSYQSQIVIMDEPTSALTDSEVRILFDMIAKLKKQGLQLYISVINWMNCLKLLM